MANTSAEERARELLDCCLRGQSWPESLLEPLLTEEHSHLLFRVVAEGLGDRFEPKLCDAYAELFSEVIARKVSGLHLSHLRNRYERVRTVRPFEGDPARVRHVLVLSRVTLGADVAVTSVLMDAARKKFPDARISLAGPRKNWELYAAAGIGYVPVAYGRSGSLDSRLGIFDSLREVLCQPDSIVIDPDSRLTQLGLLPVCPEEDYFFFESRAFGGDGNESIGTLAGHWASQVFGVDGCEPFLIPAPLNTPSADITVSLGVGENPAKRVADPFEANLLQHLAQMGKVLIDKGAGGEEAARVEDAMRGTGGEIKAWEGSFAGFAAHIAQSKLYVGYDSAGAHAAAALRVPVISIFAGFPAERMFERWRPTGSGKIVVIRAEGLSPAEVWDRTRAALKEFS